MKKKNRCLEPGLRYPSQYSVYASSKGVGKTTLIHLFQEWKEGSKAHPHTQVFPQILCSAGSKGKGVGKTVLVYRFLEREKTDKAHLIPK
jgi:hypothetical protein